MVFWLTVYDLLRRLACEGSLAKSFEEEGGKTRKDVSLIHYRAVG